MIEAIHEPISVLVSFGEKDLKPLAFRWRRQKYLVQKVHLTHTERKGNGLIYYFSVTDSANYFKLAFDAMTMRWELLELSN